MEVETALRKYLMGLNPVAGYVADRVYKHRLLDKVDGTGDRAIVIKRTGSWTRPDSVKTAEFPLVQIQFWADHDRDETGGIKVANAEDKAWAVFRVTDPFLHAKRGVRWGETTDNPGLMVVTCQRWHEPRLDEPHGRLKDQMGDSVYVGVEYALQVLHGVLT